MKQTLDNRVTHEAAHCYEEIVATFHGERTHWFDIILARMRRVARIAKRRKK
jgi:hypothetical protein